MIGHHKVEDACLLYMFLDRSSNLKPLLLASHVIMILMIITITRTADSIYNCGRVGHL